jgi:anti-sigma regulatory factor (Ser/Thr protein kinase)
MKGEATDRVLTLRIANRLDAIPAAAEEIERFCQNLGVPAATIGHVNLAIDEALTNTVSYAWPEGGAHEAIVTIRVGTDEIATEISHQGDRFNPLEAPPPDLAADLDARAVGGLGVHFIRTLMDGVTYRRVGGRNVLTLRKSIAPPGRRR